jgi:serpin B
MAATLHFELPDQQLHDAFGVLNRILHSSVPGTGYRLRMANRLWGQVGYEFVPDFLDMTREHYGAELAPVDFGGQPVEACRLINTWIEKQTEGKIQDIVSPRNIHPLTRLILTNAIYFHGDWSGPFKESATKVEPFHTEAGQDVDVPLMYQRAHFGYCHVDDVQVLQLPYGINGRLSMVVLLPDRVDGLAALEERLVAGSLGAWLPEGRRWDVEVYLPRFELKTQYDQLIRVFRSMGMVSVFDRNAADLSGITRREPLWLDAVAHKAFVRVDERGTEAAAATAIAAIGGIEEDPPEPAVFRADHPFVFLIHDDRSGAVLFLGRVVNPLH